MIVVLHVLQSRYNYMSVMLHVYTRSLQNMVVTLRRDLHDIYPMAAAFHVDHPSLLTARTCQLRTLITRCSCNCGRSHHT